MKVIGVLLLLLGLVGLVLILILWLPAKFNPIVVTIISVTCLVVVWGGGRLFRPKAGRYSHTSFLAASSAVLAASRSSLPQMRLPNNARTAVLRRLRFRPSLLLRQVWKCNQRTVKVLWQMRRQVRLTESIYADWNSLPGRT